MFQGNNTYPVVAFDSTQIDDYCSWQAKLEAIHLLFQARLHGKAAKRSDYEQIYTELFHAAASACASIAATPTTLGGDENYTSLWRSALCGLLPSLVEALEVDRIKKEQILDMSTRDCMASVMRALLSDPTHTLANCEVMLTSEQGKATTSKGGKKKEEDEADMMIDVFIGTDDDGPARQPVRAALLRSLNDKNLLLREDWKDFSDMDNIFDDWQDLKMTFQGEVEGQAADSSSSSIVMVNLMQFFEQKLQNEQPEESDLIERIMDDYTCQHAFAEALVKFVSDCIHAGELDNLARACKLFVNDLNGLDVLFLYICPTQLLQPIAGLFGGEEQDLLQNGEDPSSIGSLLLFAQVLIQKCLNANYTLADVLPENQSSFLVCFIRSLPLVQHYSRWSTIEQNVISNWITALFGSEGISDELIKSSSPQLMLRMAPTLFSQSITACQYQVIDLDTLRGGLTYFLQDLLSYTLPSAITWLLEDLLRCQCEIISSTSSDAASKSMWARAKSIRLEVLSMLLLSDNCPRLVQHLIADKTMEVLQRCNAVETNIEAERMESILETQRCSQKAVKTHLWIKIVRSSMPSCNVDSLLNLDASLGSIARKRGSKGALQLLSNSLLMHPKTEKLPRAVAMSLCLTILTKRSKTDLTDELIILFTNWSILPKNSVKSVMTTLHLTLQMLLLFDSKSEANKQVTDAMQALLALCAKRLIKKAKSKDDVLRIYRLHSTLFQNMGTLLCTL